MDAILEYINRNIKLCKPGRAWLEQQIALNRTALDVYMSCEQPDWLVYILLEGDVLSTREARVLSHHIKSIIHEFCTVGEYAAYHKELTGNFKALSEMRFIIEQYNTPSASWTLNRLDSVINAALFAVVNSSQERQERLQKLLCIIIRNDVPYHKVAQGYFNLMGIEIEPFTLSDWDKALARARSSKRLEG